MIMNVGFAFFFFFFLEIPSQSRTEKQGIPSKILYPVVALGSVLVFAVIFVAIFCLRKRRL